MVEPRGVEIGVFFFVYLIRYISESISSEKKEHFKSFTVLKKASIFLSVFDMFFLVGGFNPFEKYESKLDHFPKDRDEHKKCLKQPPRFCVLCLLFFFVGHIFEKKVSKRRWQASKFTTIPAIDILIGWYEPDDVHVLFVKVIKGSFQLHQTEKLDML